MDHAKYLKKYSLELTDEQIQRNSKLKVAVGMSGGVDSSVSALLLKLMGYQVTAFFMKNWSELNDEGVCTAEEDYKDVESVAAKLDIPYYSVSFENEYKERVFKDFVEQYKLGNTPNPDILCNKEIKFDAFYNYLMGLGFDYVATGHYCQIKESSENQLSLYKGFDDNKDQTYFLYAINGGVLKNVLFPIGHLPKPLVRQIAEEFDLVTAKKKDSTGICFIGEKKFQSFLKQYISQMKGQFVHVDTNKKLGEHSGACFYTRGQRKGLGLGGPGGPWFVVSKDLKTNTVYVAEGADHKSLYNSKLSAINSTWISKNPDFPLFCTARIRHRQAPQKCKVSLTEGQKLLVEFERPQRAIAPQQSIVLYQEDICLGGAIIDDYFD